MTDGLLIESIKKQVLLGKTNNHELKFNEQLNSLCKKTVQKLNALACIAPS